MKTRRNLTAIMISLLVPASPVLSQELAQNSEVVTMPNGETLLCWFAHEGRTYFLQASDPNDHLRTWVWSDLIESANDAEISYEVGNTTDKGFFRLHYTDTPPPAGVTLENWDADGDGLTNALELTLQAHPLNPDTSNDGIPDGWAYAHGLNVTANNASGAFQGGTVTNSEAFNQGVQAHPNATLADHDGDGVHNDLDADPQDHDVDWEPASVGAYVLIDIDVPAEAGYVRDLNDAGQVLFDNGVWTAGTWSALPKAEVSGNINDGYHIYESTDSVWKYFGPEGKILGEIELNLHSGQSDLEQVPHVSLFTPGNSPSISTETIDWLDPFLDLKAIGIDQQGRIFANKANHMYSPTGINNEIWLLDENLIKTGAYQLPASQRSSFDWHLTPSGWLAHWLWPSLEPASAGTYRSIVWDQQGNEITLPGTPSPYVRSMTDLPHGKPVIASLYPDEEGSVYLLDETATAFKKAKKLSGKGIQTFAGDGTAMTFDGNMWINGKPTPLRDLSPQYGQLLDDGWSFQVHKANKHGVYLLEADKDEDSRALLLLPVELHTKDRLVQGAVEIPDGWEDFSLSFKNKTTGEDLGTYEKLEPGALTEVMIYSDSADFFSDEEMAEASGGTLPENVRHQKVAFARDPDNERRLRFCTLFDGLGDVEIKVAFGPDQTGGTANITLTRDELMAGFISSVNEKVLSIEVSGGDDTPVDIDGDGVPDGEGSAQVTGDILQGFNAGTMAKPGAPVWEGHEENPQNLVLAINDDNDDQGGAGHVDNSDTGISAADNDIATLLLKVPANLQNNTGTMTLGVTGGSAVRIFKPDGTAPLSNYSVNLAEPSGDLAPLATERRVKILVEGITAAASITFTLTCSDAEGQPLATDMLRMMVVPRDQLAWLHAESMIQTAYGDPSRAMFRTYADNGAPQWQSISLALIGEEPVIRNRGMLAKVFFDIPINAAKKEIAWHLGYINGFWIALKGEYETVVGVWEFFTDDPYGRSAAAWAAGKEAVEILRALPEDELEQALKDIPANLTRELYTAAENNLPWEPIGGALSPDVLNYMGGFTAGTVSEAVAVSLTGAGLVAKVGTTVRGIVAGAKAGQYSLAAVNALRKATLKTTHLLLQLARTREEAAAIGTIGRYLGKVELPSGKKLSERIAEAFHDKPDLTRRFLEKYHDHWNELPEASRIVRYKLAIRRVAELKELMGDTLSDDALEGFGILQKKLFKEGVDDSDRFNDLVGLWKDLDTPAKRQSLDDSLAAYKQAVQNDPEAKFWVKDLDIVQTKGYRYVTQDTLDLINTNGGNLPAHNSRGWYCSLENYTSAADAKNALQLPGQATDYVARIEFNFSSVKDNIRIPFDAQDANKTLYEPLAKSYPDLGVGGGTQVLVDGAGMPVTIHPF